MGIQRPRAAGGSRPAVAAAAGEFPEALASIETAIKLEPRFKSMAKKDTDLDGLRSFQEFQELIK